MVILLCNGVALPAPVSLKVDDEIIWSTNTGRVDNGDMVGDVVAEKKTISIEWGVLKEDEMRLIKDSLSAGFFSFSFYDGGNITMSAYRGTLSKELIGELGDGVRWYKKVTVKVIQK